MYFLRSLGCRDVAWNLRDALEELGWEPKIAVAGFDQVFQELVAPDGRVARGAVETALVLVRPRRL